MPDVQIKLSALWVALMLTYLLGDVLRFWSGDATPGEFGGLAPLSGAPGDAGLTFENYALFFGDWIYAEIFAIEHNLKSETELAEVGGAY